MAGQIGHQRVQPDIVMLVEQLRDTRGIPEVAGQPLPPRGATLIGQRGILGVRAIIDPPPERLATTAGERGLESLAVLEGDHPPLHRRKQRVEPMEETVGHDRIEALAVIVDDPPGVGDLVLPGLEQRLEDVALVELGVASHRDHATRRGAGVDELPVPEIVLR